MEEERDYILCECRLEDLRDLVESLEPHYDIAMAGQAGICLTMLQAEDSVEKQAFYLGEALTSECEVTIRGVSGYGIVLEDQPQRAYCLAVIDALAKIQDQHWPRIVNFLQEQAKLLQEQEQQEFSKILKSAVDFKLMEEA